MRVAEAQRASQGHVSGGKAVGVPGLKDARRLRAAKRGRWRGQAIDVSDGEGGCGSQAGSIGCDPGTGMEATSRTAETPGRPATGDGVSAGVMPRRVVGTGTEETRALPGATRGVGRMPAGVQASAWFVPLIHAAAIEAGVGGRPAIAVRWVERARESYVHWRGRIAAREPWVPEWGEILRAVADARAAGPSRWPQGFWGWKGGMPCYIEPGVQEKVLGLHEGRLPERLVAVAIWVTDTLLSPPVIPLTQGDALDFTVVGGAGKGRPNGAGAGGVGAGGGFMVAGNVGMDGGGRGSACRQSGGGGRGNKAC